MCVAAVILDEIGAKNFLPLGLEIVRLSQTRRLGGLRRKSMP
ncbi:hypothetical protein M5E89_07995 [Acidaminococcus intestini]|nr:hypothetical protein M5E89_07995 [Acidaminococcus intestini]